MEWFSISQDLSLDQIREYLEQDSNNAVIFHKSDRKTAYVVYRSPTHGYRISEKVSGMLGPAQVCDKVDEALHIVTSLV